MAQRMKHPRKDLEGVLRMAEKRQWRVTRRQKYFHLWYPWRVAAASAVLD